VAQQGMVLVSSLLLLIVVTLIALSMFRSFGVQEKIAGNMREKQRAVQAAETAEIFAENWLLNNAAGTASGTCSTTITVTSTNTTQVPICSNTLPQNVAGLDVTTVPWFIGGAQVGVSYSPVGLTLGTPSTNNVSNPTYFGAPTFYISDMGTSPDASYPGEVYQVDSYGYGGNKTTVAEVESTYVVYTTSHQL
jgi:type IV pilus assembly protein PilX